LQGISTTDEHEREMVFVVRGRKMARGEDLRASIREPKNNVSKLLFRFTLKNIGVNFSLLLQ
jgi:hypothetical protein